MEAQCRCLQDARLETFDQVVEGRMKKRQVPKTAEPVRKGPEGRPRGAERAQEFQVYSRQTGLGQGSGLREEAAVRLFKTLFRNLEPR